jgi:hypothetical protein
VDRSFGSDDYESELDQDRRDKDADEREEAEAEGHKLCAVCREWHHEDEDCAYTD